MSLLFAPQNSGEENNNLVSSLLSSRFSQANPLFYGVDKLLA